MLEELTGRAAGPTGPRRGGQRTPRGTDPPDHPLQPPAGTYGARSAVRRVLAAGLVVPGIALPPTHPVPYPIPSTRPYTPVLGVPETVYGSSGTGAYGRFWDTVGEPRGLGTHRCFRVPDRLYTVI